MHKAPAIYIHIPKTAGRTLESILLKNYDVEQIFSIYEAEQYMASFSEIVAMDPKGIEAARLIMGHVFFGIHRALKAELDRPYFSFVRDPIERTISHYWYLHENHRWGKNGNMEITLSHYVNEHRTLEVANIQTRMIAGVPQDVSSFPGLGALGIRKDSLPNDRELLDLAKRNIENCFCFVGVTERFEESLQLLGKLLALPQLSYSEHNVGRNRPKASDVPAEVIEQIQARTELDRQLYDFVESRLDAQLQEHDIHQVKGSLQATSHGESQDWTERLGECLLSVEGREIESAIENLHQLEIRDSETSSELRLQATGNAPFFVLRTVEFPASASIVINVDIECGQDSTLQVYYATDSCPSFTEVYSETHPTTAGRNNLWFRITPSARLSRLRLDLGDKPDRFTLRRIQIYEARF